MEQSPLGKRLARVAREPGIAWKVLVENVPLWPTAPAVPACAWEQGDQRYAPSQGVEELLNVLRERGRSRGVEVGTESILVTNGGLDALGLVARHLKRRGARRAVCAGPVLLSVAQLFEVVGYTLSVEPWSSFCADQGFRRARLGPGDVVYLNTPHNPTGLTLDEGVAKELLREQERLGFTLIFDLVYDDFTYAPHGAASPLSLVESWRGVYGINSFSKNYGAPGLRVGWLVAEPEAIGELTAHLEIERIAVATEAQLRAAALCKYGNSPLVERVERGHRIVRAWAAEHGVSVGAGCSGTQAWLDLRVGDAERFADALMAEDRLVVTTGANYYPRAAHHIRIPTGVPASYLSDALQVLAAAMGRARRDLSTGSACHGA